MGLEEIRRRFAEELAERVGMRSARLREAFARVPREDFLDKGPWLLMRPEGYVSTPDADPAHLYHPERAVALDAARTINNSAPDLVARMIDALELAEGERVAHLGCGTGYYSAILAHVVGTSGRVLALELQPGLAARARRTLRGLRQVEVVHGDAIGFASEPLHAILVSAGVTHPRTEWLDRLRPGGRLVLPLTAVRPPRMTARAIRDHAGQVLRVRQLAAGYEARFIERVAVPALFGGRDRDIQRRLAAAFARGRVADVRSLRRDAHAEDPTCWLHLEALCLSTRPPPDLREAKALGEELT